MRILIYGGRDFGVYEKDPVQFQDGIEFLNTLSLDWPKFEEDEYGNWLPDVTIVSGGAKGADALGESWAVVNWTRLEVFKPDWDTHGKKAGILRNQDMLDSGVDLAVQFPGGRGTEDMRRRLDKAGVKVIEYKANAK